jgi:predicted nucleotidyltransferase
MAQSKRELQRRIAYEAARIMTEHRSDNIAHACHKAAARLGVSHRYQMPTRDEIDEALREQQRLLRGDEQRQTLNRLRRSALEAMRALQQFNPLLVGSVYQGTADTNSRVQLHLQANTPEDVLFTLTDLKIPWQERQRAMNFSNGRRMEVPSFQFTADGVGFELLVFTSERPHIRPLDPLDNQPVQGATLKQMEALGTIDTDQRGPAVSKPE